MHVCSYLNGVLISVQAERDSAVARTIAERRALAWRDQGYTMVQVQNGIWLGNDAEGRSAAVVAGSKPVSDQQKQQRSAAKTKREKFNVDATRWYSPAEMAQRIGRLGRDYKQGKGGEATS